MSIRFEFQVDTPVNSLCVFVMKTYLNNFLLRLRQLEEDVPLHESSSSDSLESTDPVEDDDTPAPGGTFTSTPSASGPGYCVLPDEFPVPPEESDSSLSRTMIGEVELLSGELHIRQRKKKKSL